MSRRASQWIARTQRRRQARLEGRLEAALDIIDRTLVPPSRREIEKHKHRATRALQDALEILGAY